MFDINEFNLILPTESEELYRYQVSFIKQFEEESSADVLLQIVMLQIFTPIEDFYEAIKILKAYYEEVQDIRVLFLGSFLSSAWESHLPNYFLQHIDRAILTFNKQDQAIAYYLLAYDIFMKHDVKKKKTLYIDYLNKSIALSEKFVNNYYRLAMISKKKDAKDLMKKALANVLKVCSVQECEKLSKLDFISYDFFLNEHILGIELSEPNYLSLKHFR